MLNNKLKWSKFYNACSSKIHCLFSLDEDENENQNRAFGTGPLIAGRSTGDI